MEWRLDRYVSNKITVLSFLGACFVVLIHSSYGLNSTDIHAQVYLTVFHDGIFGFAVPFFFIVSGFMFMKRFDGTCQWWRREIARRIKSLLIPYLFWTILAIVVCKCWLTQEEINLLRDFGVVTITPYNGAMWYVKVLFCMCVASPVIVALMNMLMRFGRCGLIIFAVSALLLGAPIPGFKTFFRAAYYFSFGVWLALGGANFLRMVMGGKILCFAGFLFLWLIAVLLDLHFCFPRFWLYVPVLVVPLVWLGYDILVLNVPLAASLFNHRYALVICKTSFFMYCSHEILIPFSCAGDTIMSVFVSGSLVVGLIVLIAVAMSFCAPSVFKFLTGGRPLFSK